MGRGGSGQGRNKQKRDQHGVTTDLGRGGRAGISKNMTYPHGVTTDLGRVGRAGISKNVTDAGSQLTF